MQVKKLTTKNIHRLGTWFPTCKCMSVTANMREKGGHPGGMGCSMG